jgi:VIT1/CCC1 family predicted Fe2+/Mn2+ transporter
VLRAEDFQGEIRLRCRPIVAEYAEVYSVAEYVEEDD